jgi:hypothetical protein
MTALTMHGRPHVRFDANNPDHRYWLGKFTQTQSWRDCPVRFIIPGTGNAIARMQMELLQYYINIESQNKA